MKIKIKAAFAVGAFSLVVSLASNAEASARFVFGPIEQVNSRTITVLGQTYSLSRALVESKLEIGTLVLVEGAADRRGATVARSIKVGKAPYVPGASEVAVSGIVSRYDRSTGVLTIGNLSVYLVDATVENTLELWAGSEVEVIGRQAAPFAPLWASEIRASKVRVAGTGRVVQSIEGTGKSMQSIEGTGFSVQSIEGTGKSVQSIEGTGLSLQSIEGTGKSAQSIEGTGRSAQSIEGTGKSVQSIEGTGLSLQSIEGTGKSA